MIADSFFFFFFYTAIFHRKIRIQNRVVFFPSSILITQSQRAKNYYQKSTSRKHLLEFYILYSIHFRRMDILSSNANYIKFIESLGAISCIFSYKISKLVVIASSLFVFHETQFPTERPCEVILWKNILEPLTNRRDGRAQSDYS